MNLEDFKNMWKKLGITEEGAIKCYLIGAIEYGKENEEALKMVSLTLLNEEDFVDKNGLPSRQQLYYLNLMKKYGNVAQSYLGGTPDNNYTYSYDNEIIALEQSKKGKKESKIFIQSGGKTFPTPVHLEKSEEGYWKLCGTSSIATNVKKI